MSDAARVLRIPRTSPSLRPVFEYHVGMTDPRTAQLAGTPRTLAQLVVEATEEQLDRPPAFGEWPPRVVLAHLRDDEFLCMRPALERALAEENPLMAFVEGSDWVAGRNTGRDAKAQLLTDFALQRLASTAILDMMRPGDWARQMHRAERPPFTISALVEAWLRHDAEHIGQLEAALGETAAEAQRRRTRSGDL